MISSTMSSESAPRSFWNLAVSVTSDASIPRFLAMMRLFNFNLNISTKFYWTLVIFYIIKAMSIRELTWQIKQVVLEAQNFTSILPSLRIFSLKTYEISDLGQLVPDLGQLVPDLGQTTVIPLIYNMIDLGQNSNKS